MTTALLTLPARGELEVVGARERRFARLGLVVVVLGAAMLHLVVGLDRAINWDEAIHLTQVTPGRPAVFMEPHRTRGLSLLVSPIAVFDPSMVVLRAYLLLLVSVGTFAAFAAWIRVVGFAAPLAAALFVTHWVSIFYAVELLPSMPSALLAVAAAGLVAQVVVGTDEVAWRGPVLGVLFLVFALVRPPDAVVVGIALGVFVLLLRREHAIRILLPAAIGGVVGLGVWFLEGAIRFGFSPRATMASASEYSVDGERFNQLPLYLVSLERRLRCAGSCIQDFVDAGRPWELPPIRTTTFLAVASLATLLALAIGPLARRAALTALVPAGAVVAFYSMPGGAMNLRYMMPAFATGIVAAAVGARIGWRAVPPNVLGWGLRGAFVLLLVATMVWQAGHGTDRLSGTGGTRYRAADLAAALEPHLDGGPCVIGAAVNYPQIQYWTRCPAAPVVRGRDGELQHPLGERGSYVDLSAHAQQGADVLAVVRADPHEESPIAGWELLESDLAAERGYEIRRWRSEDPLPPPPCPGSDGAERRLADVLSAHCD